MDDILYTVGLTMHLLDVVPIAMLVPCIIKVL